MQKIVRAQYTYPNDIPLSNGCKDLIKRVFVADPNKRITLEDIKRHPWFQRNLPRELQVRAMVTCPAACSSQHILG